MKSEFLRNLVRASRTRNQKKWSENEIEIEKNQEIINDELNDVD